MKVSISKLTKEKINVCKYLNSIINYFDLMGSAIAQYTLFSTTRGMLQKLTIY